MKTWTEEKLRILRTRAKLLGVTRFFLARTATSREYVLLWSVGDFPNAYLRRKTSGVSERDVAKIVWWLNQKDARVQAKHYMLSYDEKGRMKA